VEPADVVLRFLASVGRADDAEFYLALFRAEARERFALLHVDANVMRGAADAVALELGFLAALGLSPTVTLGLFAPAEAGEDARSLRRRLDAARVPAALVGGAADAAAAARRGEIPIMALAGGNDERELQLLRLVDELASRKLIFLARAGGFRVKGEVVPLVNLSTEAEALGRSRDLTRKEQAILSFARRAVFGVGHRLTVAVTSPLDLLRELFTVKGAGTMLRRGAVFLRQRFADVDRDRLTALLSSSFGRPPVEAFFEQPIAEVNV
jgi:acetylglutamate kinase